MKKIITVFIITVIIISSQLFTNCEEKKETVIASKSAPKPLTEVQKRANREARAKWEASPNGIQYKKWQNSPEGKKVQASHDKIRKQIQEFTTMEAVVTSVTFEREDVQGKGSKWLLVQIESETYMMQFVPKEFEQLKSLQVNDKISLKSRSVGYSNNHPYLIIRGDYIAKDNKVLFKRNLSKNNRC
jgi:ABC-type molybdate transport system substrate-binding protein